MARLLARCRRETVRWAVARWITFLELARCTTRIASWTSWSLCSDPSVIALRAFFRAVRMRDLKALLRALRRMFWRMRLAADLWFGTATSEPGGIVGVRNACQACSIRLPFPANRGP